MSVKWYEWDSWESFNQWHDNLCQSMGYPWDGTNQATGLKDENATKTLRYTDGKEVEGKIIAIVEDEFSSELIETTIRPPVLEDFKPME